MLLLFGRFFHLAAQGLRNPSRLVPALATHILCIIPVRWALIIVGMGWEIMEICVFVTLDFFLIFKVFVMLAIAKVSIAQISQVVARIALQAHTQHPGCHVIRARSARSMQLQPVHAVATAAPATSRALATAGIRAMGLPAVSPHPEGVRHPHVPLGNVILRMQPAVLATPMALLGPLATQDASRVLQGQAAKVAMAVIIVNLEPLQAHLELLHVLYVLLEHTAVQEVA